MSPRPRRLSDIDYEALAQQVANAVWSSNATVIRPTIETTGNFTITYDTNTQDGRQLQQQLGEPPSGIPHLQFPEYDANLLVDDTVAALTSRVEELEKTLKMVAILLDEHIKRTNPIPTNRAKRSIILDQEEDDANAAEA
jgi:hypothetical protein